MLLAVVYALRRWVSLVAGTSVMLICASCGTDAQHDVAHTTRFGPAEASRPIVLAAAGDFGTGSDAKATLQTMGRARPDIMLGLGDFSYAGPGSEERWCRMVKSRVGHIPVELVSGNHEDDTGGDGELANFAKCLPDRADATGHYGTEYYFDVPGLARVVLISPDLTVGGEYFYYGKHNSHYRWLGAVIDAARTARLPWVIVAMHKNCLSVGV